MRRVTNTRRPARYRFAAARLVVLVTLLAFSVQTYLTQTHVHFAAEDQTSLAQSQLSLGDHNISSKTPVEHKDRYPANDDPANCPLCQELIHAGHFVAPAAAALLLPAHLPSIVELTVQYAPFLHTITHIWRGRAPPLG